MVVQTKPKVKIGEASPGFDLNLLSEQENKDFEFVKRRIVELRNARQERQYNVKLERIWADADEEYTPHRLNPYQQTTGRRFIIQDEDRGWRGTPITLGSQNWQSDISQPNPYIKIQTALSILIDQNPTGVFSATSKKFQATSELMRQLYQRSWEFARSKQQLKLFTFNLAKYGWACARTYPLRIARKVKQLIEFNQENPDKSNWQDKEVVEFNDIMRENLDPWNTWIDDTARPNNQFSIRDWCWRKVYTFDSLKEEFGNYSNWQYVKPGGIITDKVTGEMNKVEKRYKERELVEVYFYENRLKDLFIVLANPGVPLVISPLPISDAQGNKKLSLWQTYWNLRHAESPYGIGIYESMRYDHAMLDRVRNMTLDQLTLSIYKMFFYQGTQNLMDTGDITISPGVGKQVLDPKNITFLQIPGPGAEAWQAIDKLRKDIDESSGVNITLEGEITGRTAFEIAQAKEAALKRLKTPLDNILDALTQEGYISVSLIQLLYSIPETYEISDSNLISQYLQEIQSDPNLYERSESGAFTAKVYREFPLNLQPDEKGNLIETQDTRFFRVKPGFLQWEGVVNIKPQSVLTPSKQVDKALEMEMWNILIPLFAQPPQLYTKAAKSIVKLYDKDPREVLPDSWLGEQTPNPLEAAQQQPGQQGEQQGGEPLFVPQQQGQQAQAALPAPSGNQTLSAPTLVSRATLPAKPQGILGRLVSRLVGPRTPQ